MLIGYVRFRGSAEDYYYRTGENAAGIVALLIDADALDTYVETLTPDADYWQTLQNLNEARLECEAQALYVFRATEDGTLFIYDTDPSEWHYDLGHFEPYVLELADGATEDIYPEATARQLRGGGPVDTITGRTVYGWTITVNEPLYGRDGSCKGYVGIDFDVNQMIAERMAYLRNMSIVIIIITVVFAAIYLFIVRRAIINPINIMAKAADSFLVNSLESGESLGESDILSMEIHTGDEMQSLAEALQSMVHKIDEHLANLNLVTIKAETDVLTSLFNRGAFEQRVSAILRLRPEEKQLNAFLMIDIDFFKNINDNYGHAAGDTVLAECAAALLKVMRDSDVVGRLGGDEFAIFCKSIGSVAMAETKAMQIREEWRKVIPPGGEKGVTASIGIAFSPRDGQAYQELFGKADVALYQAKAAGRDRFVVAQAESGSF
jgi:diguanylate cyclase (GGDEF)-like protein